MADMESLEVEADVSEANLSKIKVGQPDRREDLRRVTALRVPGGAALTRPTTVL